MIRTKIEARCNIIKPLIYNQNTSSPQHNNNTPLIPREREEPLSIEGKYNQGDIIDKPRIKKKRHYYTSTQLPPSLTGGTDGVTPVPSRASPFLPTLD